jgi:signal transduction histidine kinase
VLLNLFNRRDATLARLIGLALITYSVLNTKKPPALHGRGLVILVLLAIMVVVWLIWAFWSSAQRKPTPDLYLLALTGSLLAAASPTSAASVAPFIAVMAMAVRVNIKRGFAAVAISVVGMGTGAIIYSGHDGIGLLGLLAYSGGWCAVAFAGANIRNTELRAEQAELLLAQTQRSHEEQLRATRLEEQTRIARDIHDVLAHSLAGLTIQLEATSALLDQGVDPESIRERVDRARDLARDGLREARRAVGALRGDQPVSLGLAIKALVDAYQAEVEVAVRFELSGDSQLLDGPAGEAVLRVVQEALTNVRKHAPGAEVSVAVDSLPEMISATIEDRQAAPVAVGAGSTLQASGGGYGLRGMRERAELLGGTLQAGPTDDGWRVEMRLPLEAQK